MKGIIPAILASVRGVYGLIISILIAIGRKFSPLSKIVYLAIEVNPCFFLVQ